MLATVIVIIVLVGMAGTVMVVSLSSKLEHRTSENTLKAQYLAEAGVSDKISQMIAGNLADLGSSSCPIPFAGGSYWVTVESLDPAHKLYRLTARASYDHNAETIETVLRPFVDTVYQDAIFAGDDSGDPDYVLTLGGTGGQADVIHGDIYSGNNIAMHGAASVDGEIRARRRVTGANGSRAISRQNQGFAGMHPASTSDYDVRELFATATYQSSRLGGSAWQMPRESPVHIFRKNPSDRALFTDATPGDDYFLEDPYGDVRVDADSDGSDATKLVLTKAGGLSDSSGNHRVFYVEGNLWIFNLKTNSFLISQPPDDPCATTIIVEGNLYVADNLFYGNPHADGLALIALRDAAQSDSGNIVLGDPSDGTLREVDAFLFAENDLVGRNLGAVGSRSIAIRGNLAAGNQVILQRDELEPHSKLTVDHDDRLVSGRLSLPGLSAQISRVTAYAVLSWRQTAAP